MVEYPLKSLASKEREAKIKSKFRVSDKLNEQQMRDSERKLAEARARQVVLTEKEKKSKWNRTYREKQKRKRDDVIPDTTLSGKSVITEPVNSGDVASLPLETGEKSETLPIDSDVAKKAVSSELNTTETVVASLMISLNRSFPLETGDKSETLPIDGDVGKTTDSSELNATEMVVSSELNATEMGVASLLIADTRITSENMVTETLPVKGGDDSGGATESGMAILLNAADSLACETVATDSVLVPDSGVSTETRIDIILDAARRLDSESVETERLPMKSGKSNDNTIVIDDDEKSLDDECCIYDEVSLIDFKTLFSNIQDADLILLSIGV
jgi:hypothetical protein